MVRPSWVRFQSLRFCFLANVFKLKFWLQSFSAFQWDPFSSNSLYKGNDNRNVCLCYPSILSIQFKCNRNTVLYLCKFLKPFVSRGSLRTHFSVFVMLVWLWSVVLLSHNIPWPVFAMGNETDTNFSPNWNPPIFGLDTINLWPVMVTAKRNCLIPKLSPIQKVIKLLYLPFK